MNLVFTAVRLRSDLLSYRFRKFLCDRERRLLLANASERFVTECVPENAGGFLEMFLLILRNISLDCTAH
jgi:hypothetical protein